MKEGRGFVAGVLTTILVLSLMVTAQASVGKKTMTADYNNIKIELDGQQITPKDVSGNVVEPFAVNGTTYLPVRAVSEALGIDVEWDGSTSTVILSRLNTAPFGSDTDKNVRMIGFYKILEDGFTELKTEFDSIINGAAVQTINDTVSSGPYEGKTFLEATKEMLSTSLMLVEDHYSSCREYLSDDDIALVSEYRRLNSLAISHMESISSGSQLTISNIQSVAFQAYMDCSGHIMDVNNRIWGEYQSYFN